MGPKYCRGSSRLGLIPPDPIVVDGRLTLTRPDRRAVFLRRRTCDPQRLWRAGEGQGGTGGVTEAQHKGFILEPTTDTRAPAT